MKNLNKTLSRIEEKLDILLTENNLWNKWQEKKMQKAKTNLELRRKLAEQNSKDKQLVEEARKFYKLTGKINKVNTNEPVLYIKKGKAYWVYV